jgi:hypothetical protein
MNFPNWISTGNIEWAARLYMYLRRRPLTRYGGILILGALALYSNIPQLMMAAALTWAGKPFQLSDPPERVVFFAIAIGASLIVLDRVLPDKTVLPTAYPHDEKLMRTIRDSYTPELDRFLRTWAFGNGSFKSNVLNPLDGIRFSRGAQYEFIDPEVNQAWKNVREAAQVFMKDIGEKTIPARRGDDRITPFYDHENIDFHSPDMIERCKALDDGATKLVEEWDKFDAISQRRIPHVV